MSYQVIIMSGQNEPWWFFEDWQDDIVWEEKFEDFDSARKCYQKKYMEFAHEYQNMNEKMGYMAAFWNEGEYYYCEDCADDVQLYHGLLITENYKPINI